MQKSLLIFNLGIGYSEALFHRWHQSIAREIMLPQVSINLVVRNGQDLIRPCLKAVFRQTGANILVKVFDDNSEDQTKEIIRSEFPEVTLIESSHRRGFGGGQTRLFKLTSAPYIVALSVDVILDKDFVKKGVETMEKMPSIGALQGKTLLYSFKQGQPVTRNGRPVIDTCGFQIFRSRRLINRGHGQEDRGQFDKPSEIFSYEGACGFFRRKALEQALINGELFDEDLFWYATDIDLGWRLRLLGWKSYYQPAMVAFHDRPTTQRLSRSFWDFVKLRKNIPCFKRRLDWRNYRLVLFKYSFWGNILRDWWPILKREVALFAYIVIFEPFVLLAIPQMIKLLPRMIKKRRNIMRRRKVESWEIRKWMQAN